MPSLCARRYQQEVFERALRQNVIAVLETGTGKTLIAIMLLQHYAQEAAVKRKQAVFLVPTVSLAAQVQERPTCCLWRMILPSSKHVIQQWLLGGTLLVMTWILDNL